MYEYKKEKEEVKVGDVVIWRYGFLGSNITINKPYLVVEVDDFLVKVIDNNGKKSDYIGELDRRTIKTKSGKKAKVGDICMVTDSNISDYGKIITISYIYHEFIYWNKNASGNYNSIAVVLEKEKNNNKQTLEEYYNQRICKNCKYYKKASETKHKHTINQMMCDKLNIAPTFDFGCNKWEGNKEYLLIEKSENNTKKQTLQEYLIENDIFDKFIYNIKSENVTDGEKVTIDSFNWRNSIEGYNFWLDYYVKSPTYDGSMDSIIDRNEDLSNDYIIFRDIDEIKEAVEEKVLEEYYINSSFKDKSPVIFKLSSNLKTAFQTNEGSENIWSKDKYRKWITNSITWSVYKSKMGIPEKPKLKKRNKKA